MVTIDPHILSRELSTLLARTKHGDNHGQDLLLLAVRRTVNDPTYKWTNEEERKLIKRMFYCFMYSNTL